MTPNPFDQVNQNNPNDTSQATPTSNYQYKYYTKDPFAGIEQRTTEQHLQEVNDLTDRAAKQMSLRDKINRETGDFAPGIVQGVTKFIQDAAQTSLAVNKAIFPNRIGNMDKGLNNYISNQRNQFDSQYPNGKPMGEKIGEFTGENVIPTLATLPFTGGSATGTQGIINRALVNAGTSGILSSTVAPEGSKIQAGLIGAGVGGALSAAIDLAPTVLQKFGAKIGNGNAAEKPILQEVSKATGASERVKSAQDIGVTITPAEAAQTSKLIKQQAKIGTTPQVQKAMDSFFDERNLQTAKALDNFNQKIIPTTVNENITKEGRTAAQQIIDKYVNSQKQAAQPLYDQADQTVIPAEMKQALMQDPYLASRYATLQKDPIFQKVVKGLPTNSLGELDQLKQFMDDDYLVAAKAGNLSRARIIQDSIQNLKSNLDSLSPEYQMARKLYEASSTQARYYSETALGQLGGLQDNDLESFIPKLFNPKQTSKDAFTGLRDELLRNDRQDIWYGMVRKHIQDRLDNLRTINPQPGDLPLNYYKTILGTGADRARMLDALKFNEPAQQNLKNIITTFSSLGKKTNTINAKSTAFGMNIPKGHGDTIFGTLVSPALDLGKHILKGGQNNAIAKVIFSPEWMSHLSQMANTSARSVPKGLQMLQDMVSRVGGIETNRYLSGED